MPPGFPHFQDADVHIQLTTSETDHVFKLHSQILCVFSGWFNASLSHRWDSHHSNGEVRFYQLEFDKHSTTGLLTRVKAFSNDAKQKTTELHTFGREPNDDDTPDEGLEEVLKDRDLTVLCHRFLFETMYHITPEFPQAWDSPKCNLMGEYKLAELALLYDAVDAATPFIEKNIRRRQDDGILQGILNDPCCFVPSLQISSRLRLDWLFRKSLIPIAVLDDFEYSLRIWKLKKSDIGTETLCLLEKLRANIVSALLALNVELMTMDISAWNSGCGKTNCGQHRHQAAMAWRDWCSFAFRPSTTKEVSASYNDAYKEIWGNLWWKKYTSGSKELDDLLTDSTSLWDRAQKDCFCKYIASNISAAARRILCNHCGLKSKNPAIDDDSSSSSSSSSDDDDPADQSWSEFVGRQHDMMAEKLIKIEDKDLPWSKKRSRED